MLRPLSIPSPPYEWAHYTIGPLTLHAYAFCILAGIVAAVMLTSRRLTARGAQPGVVVDFALVVVPLALIGARIYHVLTHPGDYFGEDIPLWRVLAFWEGGIAMVGSLIGGAVGTVIACRWTGIRFWAFADALAPGLLLGQAIGRLGNWFNVELYGQPTDLPWGLEVPADNPAYPLGLPDGTLFHPTFLYEMVWNGVGVVLILLLDRKWRQHWGRAFGMYCIWYGIGRSVFESIRIDPTEVFFGLRVNVWAAFALVAIGIVLVVAAGRHPGVEPSVYRRGREWVPEGAVGSRYTEADFEDDAADSERVPVTSGGAPGR